MHLIRPGKRNQNPYVDSFKARLRNKYLNERQFPTTMHARTGTETWQWEYHDERAPKILRDPTPAAYAKQLAAIGATMKFRLLTSQQRRQLG